MTTMKIGEGHEVEVQEVEGLSDDLALVLLQGGGDRDPGRVKGAGVIRTT